MGRIIGIDYGKKRTGLAVTDKDKIIASPLITIQAKETINYLKDYTEKEPVEAFVVGYAKTLQNEDSESMQYIRPFVQRLKKQFPGIPVEMIDERFTSKMAEHATIAGGMKKKERREKSHIDKISASLILQSYLERYKNS